MDFGGIMQSQSKFSVPEKIQALSANRGAFFHVPLYFSCLSFARYIIILQTKELSMNQVISAATCSATWG